MNIIELYKNSVKCIRKNTKEKKKVKGIYCGNDDKIWFCDVDKLYYKYNKHPSEDKVFNLERLEKIYSTDLQRRILTTLDYFDTTQLLAYDEVGHYLYYLSDACNFIRISLDKVSNNVKDFVKNITTISPKPIKIFNSILEYESDTILDSKVLNNLFEGKHFELTSFDH